MKTKIENAIFTNLNGKYLVDVDHDNASTIISVKHRDAEVFVTIDERLLTLSYTPDLIQDFEEISSLKLDLVDATALCIRISNLLG